MDNADFYRKYKYRKYKPPPMRRSGTFHLYTMQDGENCAVLPNGRMVITHPDRAPKIINLDGSEEPLSITSHEFVAVEP